MLLPQLHEELRSAARRPRSVRRLSRATARVIAAAVVALLIAAPSAQAGLRGGRAHATSSLASAGRSI